MCSSAGPGWAPTQRPQLQLPRPLCGPPPSSSWSPSGSWTVLSQSLPATCSLQSLPAGGVQAPCAHGRFSGLGLGLPLSMLPGSATFPGLADLPPVASACGIQRMSRRGRPLPPQPQHFPASQKQQGTAHGGGPGEGLAGLAGCVRGHSSLGAGEAALEASVRPRCSRLPGARAGLSLLENQWGRLVEEASGYKIAGSSW